MIVDAQGFEQFLLRHFKIASFDGGLDTRLGALGLDSLDLLDLILAIESDFAIAVDVDAINEDMTLREIHQRLIAANR